MIFTRAFKPFEIKLSEANDNGRSPVQVLRLGKFKHKRYGNFEITAKTLSDMIANFDARTYGIDISFDYFHESESIAAGWVKRLYLSEDKKALWAEVEWTPSALKRLSEKEIRYFSPEFAQVWENPETGEIVENILFGGGLTNRPYIKEMEPIAAHEKGSEMTLEEMKKQMDDLKALVLKLSEPKKEVKGDAENKSLEDVIKELRNKNEKLESDLKSLNEAKALSEKTARFDVLLSEGKVCVAQKESFLKDDMEGFMKLSEKMNTQASGEKGDTAEHKQDDGDFEDKVLELSEKMMKDDKALAYEDAVRAATLKIRSK